MENNTILYHVTVVSKTFSLYHVFVLETEKYQEYIYIYTVFSETV